MRVQVVEVASDGVAVGEAVGEAVNALRQRIYARPSKSYSTETALEVVGMLWT
jgi:hypothetical protein